MEKKKSREMKTIQPVLRPKGKRKIPPKMDTCMLNRLLWEIIIDIHSRLPADSILESRHVCKTWRNLIRHPSFAHMHVHRNGNIYSCHSSVTGAKVGSDFLFLLQTLPQNSYLVYYGEFADQPNKKLRRVNQPTINCLSIAGSRNGLVCFSDSNHVRYIHEPVYISNPMTREYMNFPRLEVSGGSKVDSMVCGFGYLPSVDKYKIIKIYYIQNQLMGRVQVYTLGGGRCSVWRDIGETTYSLRYIPDGFRCHRSPFGAFANGALHWLDKEQKIVSFDLAEEKFYLLPSPPFVSALDVTNSFELEVFGGCLCFIHQKQDKFLDIWFLRKKGGSSSYDVNEQEYDLLTWIKELSLPIDALPFALTQSGKFLMWYKSSTIWSYSTISIWSYDPKIATIEKLFLNGNFCRAIPHMNSFVSLKGLGEKCRSRKRYAVNPSPEEYFITQQRKDNGEFDVIQF